MHKQALDITFCRAVDPESSVCFRAPCRRRFPICKDYNGSRQIKNKKVAEDNTLVSVISIEPKSKKRSKPSPHLEAKRVTKKEQILSLYKQGIKDVAEIAEQTSTRTSYVSYVLSKAGLLEGYFDLYTTTAKEQNAYSRYFRSILAFKDEKAAQISIGRIDELYRRFEQLGDRAGQHQAMVIALTGMNRARWSGKTKEADVFRSWLHSH
jgi:hypothetical protein